MFDTDLSLYMTVF